jgi:hypothetical protein
MKQHFFLFLLGCFCMGAGATQSNSFYISGQQGTVSVCKSIDAVTFSHTTISSGTVRIYPVGSNTAVRSLTPVTSSPTASTSWPSAIGSGSYYVVAINGTARDTSNIIALTVYDGAFNVGKISVSSTPSPHQCIGGILMVKDSVSPTIPTAHPPYHLEWYYNPSFGSNISLPAWQDSLHVNYTAVNYTQHTFFRYIVYSGCITSSTTFVTSVTSTNVIGIPQYTVSGGGTITSVGGSVAITVSGNNGSGNMFYVYNNGIIDTVINSASYSAGAWSFTVRDSGTYTIQSVVPNPPNADSCKWPLLGSAHVSINIPAVLSIHYDSPQQLLQHLAPEDVVVVTYADLSGRGVVATMREPNMLYIVEYRVYHARYGDPEIYRWKSIYVH